MRVNPARRGCCWPCRFWLPAAVGGYTDLASRVLIYALAAMGLNLLLGFTGGLSFGHAAYFGLGAYGTGLMLDNYTSNTLLALLVGTLTGGLAALLLGPIAVRRRGIYFSMITIAIGQMFYFIAVRWNSFTGGEDGLTGFSRQPIFGWQLGSTHFYYLVLFFFGLGALVLVDHSEFAARPYLRRDPRKSEAADVSRHPRGALHRALLRDFRAHLRAGRRAQRAAG